MKNHQLIFLLIVLSFVSTACTGASPQAAQTAAAATLDAGVAAAGDQAALLTAEAANSALQATVDALATQNAVLQSQGTATANAQATLSAVTPQVISPGGAACRFGPDGGFNKVADLDGGVPYDALGRSLNGEWWQIASPDDDGSTCWVFWSQDLQFLGEVFNLAMVSGPSLPTATFAPSPVPGIGIHVVNTTNCSGARYAIIRVLNLGNETYQSAIVKLSDAAGTELNRSDGNNEFLPGASCPGNEGPTLGPRQERYVTVAIKGASSGDDLLVRVTVCTEKGYGGNCYSSTASFTN